MRMLVLQKMSIRLFSMRYSDRIYGDVTIDEPVVEEIIASPDFQRLRGVDQAGYFETYFPGTTHSRFEHSVGCYILLTRYGASLDERIAGLVHDVSHTAFSHTADYVFAAGSGSEHNYQDDVFDDFFRRTDIPAIIVKHGLYVEDIIDHSRHTLQETTLPDLCADRIDYALRGMQVYCGYASRKTAFFLEHLKVHDGVWVFDTYDSAYAYARTFKELNDTYYSGTETAAMFYRTSQWLLYAVRSGYISARQMHATDHDVIARINVHIDHDARLKMLWDEMNNSLITIGTKGEPHAREITVKSRAVDPFFMENGSMYRVSDRDHSWKETVLSDLVPKVHYLITSTDDENMI